jgi:hypothetical protein
MPASPKRHPRHPSCPSQRSAQRGAGCLLATALTLLLVSCASPGAPRPPSLHLPDVPSDLTAQRVGSRVLLHWTTPSRTTDGFAAPAPLTAEICRETSPAAPPPQKKSTPAPNCAVVLRFAAVNGPCDAADPLPAPLTTDPATPLSYRIRILNPDGRSAGLSKPAIAAAGATPLPVTGLHALTTRNGILLEWHPSDQPSLVELRRDLLPNDKPATPAIKPGTQKHSSIGSFGTPPSSPATAVLRAEGDRLSSPRPDTGGILDRTAQRGETYTYRAQRLRTVTLDGHLYELRSEPSPPITVNLTDTFPPLTPTGLAAVPSNNGTAPTIDLSWQPNTDLDLAGYHVYRRTASGTFQRITQQPIFGPAFTDTAVTPGTPYTYRVTAIDNAGNESPPSTEVTETARSASNP